MNNPFFSIIIPTRNRPDLLRDSILSVLLQNFEDYEVVVSDNFNDEKTQKVIDEFTGYGRFRFVRSERLLSMPEHWEFASRQAKGTYVLFVTDRSVLKQNALRTIYTAIKAENGDVQICSWSWSLYDDVAGREFGQFYRRKESRAEIIPSQLITKNFTEVISQYPYSLPRGMNSCYRRDLVSSLQEQYGAVFRPISPDFTSAFLLLAHVNKVMFIDQSLFLSQGLDVSNGGNTYAKTAAKYLQSLGERNWFTHVPIKSPLVENTIFQDYLSIQEMAGGTLSHVKINWIVYFEKTYREIIEKKGAGLLSKKELNELYLEWSLALAAFDSSLQNEVHRRVKRLIFPRLKAQLKSSDIGPIAVRLKRAIDIIRQHRWHVGKHQSALEAAGFAKHFFQK